MNKSITSATSVVLLVAVSLACGYMFGTGEQPSPESAASPSVDVAGPSKQLRDVLLQADTATSGQKISMATGSIDGDVDVVFTLDHESGNLFAWLPGPDRAFLGEWTVNVATAIGLEKGANPDLLMTIGNFNVRIPKNGQFRAVPLICYVANGENGRVAGFGFQWNPNLAQKGAFQSGVLLPLLQGSTREQTLKRQ